MGGMLASSEWIYWETLSLLIGTMGVKELSIHTIPTQVIMVTFMLPLGIGTALAIRLGHTLPRNVQRAKALALWCWLLCALLWTVMSTALYTQRQSIYRLFTHELDVMEGAEEIWWNVCFYFFQLGLFGINMGITTGLGMQWSLGVTTVVCLWVIGLPVAYYYAIVQGGGLGAAWSWVWPPYVAMNLILMHAFCTKNWDEIAILIRLREGCCETDSLETASLKLYSDDEDDDIERAITSYGAIS